MLQDIKVTVDIEKIRTAIHAGIPLTITTYTLPHEMEFYMREVLSEFLAEVNQPQVVDYLTYSLEELINNAKKANTKRVYFAEKGLNIENPKEYELGMEKFKVDTLKNIKYYLYRQKQEGLYVKLVLQTRKNKIKIEVRNNSAITYYEYKRIHDKLSRAQQYTSVDEVMNYVLDETEGAGLGLIIMILMLEKIGLTEENYQVICENGETITRLILPFNDKKKKEIALFSEEYAKLIDGLPAFPENILKITKLLNDPDVRLNEISLQLAGDAELTNNLIKMVNATSSGLKAPCRSFEEAVNLLGTRAVRNMLYAVGSLGILTKMEGITEKDLWIHSNRVAFYAYNIASNFCSPEEKAVVDDSYICGLMHDVGKIVFETGKNALIERMQHEFEFKGYASDTYEKLTAGVNHGDIGAQIVDKWNFPRVISDAIRFHHFPEDVDVSQKKITSVVYLADMMAHYSEQTVDFYQFDPKVLALFKISNEGQIKTMAERMEAAFEDSF